MLTPKFPKHIEELYRALGEYYETSDPSVLAKKILRWMGDKALISYMENIGCPISGQINNRK